MDSVLIPCQNCSAVNRVIKEKLLSKPKCGKCSSPLVIVNSPVDISGSSFKKEVIEYPGVVLVDFWSITCGHCMRLNPVLDQIAAEYAGIIKVAKVNAQTERHLALQFDIRGVPTLILYRNGKKVNQVSGAMDKQNLLKWIASSAGIQL